MNNFRFFGHIDPWSVLVQLHKHRSLFVEHTMKLRSAEGLDTPAYADWKSLKAMIAKARAAVGMDDELEDVAIHRLPPGASTMWGTNNEPDLAVFHIPLLTSPGAQIFCQNEAIHAAVGTVCWFRHDLPHSEVNWGSSPRIHLVFHCRKKKVELVDPIAEAQG